MEYTPPLNALPGDEEDDNRSYWDADPAGESVALRQGAFPPSTPFEAVQREIVNVIDEAGLTPDGGDLTQLHQAIEAIIAVSVPETTLFNNISGLVISQDADGDHDIQVSTGLCADSTNTTVLTLSSAITKQIDVDWAEGDGDGGFPSGLTIANDTWYHLFVIAKADGTTDAGFDTSLTAANLLADATGYTKYRRVGSVLTDASANILDFTATDIGGALRVVWKDAKLDVDVTNLGTSQVSYTMSSPIGIPCLLYGYGSIVTNAASVVMLDLSQTDSAPNVNNPPGIAFIRQTEADTNNFICQTNTSSEVGLRSTIGSTEINVITHSFTDYRRV